MYGNITDQICCTFLHDDVETQSTLKHDSVSVSCFLPRLVHPRLSVTGVDECCVTHD